MITIADPARYKNLTDIVRRHECKRIVEIGVFDGVHSAQMIAAALQYHEPNDVVYFGFDLFEDMSLEMLEKEFSKRPYRMDFIRRSLEFSGAHIFLFKGNTKDTLPAPLDKLRGVDFVFIDGGHSEETIASDWRNVEKIMGADTIVIFDDYYIDPPPKMDGIGCNALIDGLDRARYHVELLEPVDSFQKPWGLLQIQMVKVGLRRQ